MFLGGFSFLIRHDLELWGMSGTHQNKLILKGLQVM
jgi:hypothetical protein